MKILLPFLLSAQLASAQAIYNYSGAFNGDITGGTNAIGQTIAALASNAASTITTTAMTGLPSGGLTNFSVYATGSAYSLTASSNLVALGTQGASITLQKPGTYLVEARAKAKYNAATFAANQTAYFSLRKTNAPVAIIGSTNALQLRIITTITDNAGIVSWAGIYTTATASDTLQIFGNLSATPSAGSVQVDQADIMAIQIR